MPGKAMINITVVTCNRLSLTKICLESLYAMTREEHVVTVVDNGSTDGTRPFLEDFVRDKPHMRIIALRRNMGVAVAANVGWAAVDADFYLKLDNDIRILRPDWLEALLRILRDPTDRGPEAGIVGHRVIPWHGGTVLPLRNNTSILSSFGCNGACVLIPRRTHERLGFWNEDYGKYGFEDLEYGNRVLLLDQLIGYHPEDGFVRHLGYADDGVIDAAYERFKKSCHESQTTGQKLYLVNKFLFESGVRPLYVQRRYLPAEGSDGTRFTLNPEYVPITRLQNEILGKIEYSVDGDKIALDLKYLLGLSDAE